MYTGSVLTWGYSSPGWELLEGKDWVWVLSESSGHRMGLERIGNGIELGIGRQFGSVSLVGTGWMKMQLFLDRS